MAPNYRQVAVEAAQRYGIDPRIFTAQIQQESGFRTGLSSSAGAQGIAQIMPGTARAWGVNPNDPVAALDAAARNMAKYVRNYNGNYGFALAAYNAGEGAVKQYNGIPPYRETQHYVKTILGAAKAQPGMPTAPAPAAAQKPSYAPQGPALDQVALSNQANRISIAYADAPDIGQSKIKNLYDSATQGLSAIPGSPRNPKSGVQAGPSVQTGAGVPVRRPGETGQQYLDRVLMAKFGLRHDPGNTQTTGGRHMPGSDHYKGKATDFGDGLNTKAQLLAAEKYLNQNAGALGVSQTLYGPDDDPSGGHNDHLHTATLRSLRPGMKKPVTASVMPANGPAKVTPPPTINRIQKRRQRPVKSKRGR